MQKRHKTREKVQNDPQRGPRRPLKHEQNAYVCVLLVFSRVFGHLAGQGSSREGGRGEGKPSPLQEGLGYTSTEGRRIFGRRPKRLHFCLTSFFTFAISGRISAESTCAPRFGRKPRNLRGLGTRWARNLLIYVVWASAGPETS